MSIEESESSSEPSQYHLSGIPTQLRHDLSSEVHAIHMGILMLQEMAKQRQAIAADDISDVTSQMDDCVMRLRQMLK